MHSKEMGGFLIKIRKREAAVHTTIHNVYKKTRQSQPIYDFLPLISIAYFHSSSRYGLKGFSMHACAHLSTRLTSIVSATDSSQYIDPLASSMSLNPYSDHISSTTGGASSFFSTPLSQLHPNSKICDNPHTLLGSSLNSSLE